MDAPAVNIKRFSRSKKVRVEEQPPPMPTIDEEPHEDNDEDFLADLKNTPAPPPHPPSEEEAHETDGDPVAQFFEPHLDPPPFKRADRKSARSSSKGWGPIPEFNDMFSATPTPLLGRQRRELLTRLKEFKVLFPEQLKSFKVKEKASDDELQEALKECETIVSCGGIQQLADEALLMAIQGLEAASARTQNWDFTGTSQALRHNPQFQKTCRLLWIKYRLFSNVPPEAQLALIVSSTALVCRQQNLKKKLIGEMLNTQT